jgi:transposase
VYDKAEYKERIKIEHIFARIKQTRRISERYDKLLRNYSSFVFLKITQICINIMNELNN